jgi:hypothetical protein
MVVWLRSVTDTSNWICDWAYFLSVEMVPTAPEANGSSTLLTCFTFSMALIWSSIGAWWSVIGPEVDSKTSCPVVPDACGKRSSRVSMPCWDSVPGIV